MQLHGEFAPFFESPTRASLHHDESRKTRGAARNNFQTLTVRGARCGAGTQITIRLAMMIVPARK
jgi:hypothetical protein